MSKIKSVHEVYFLVRVGQMTEEDLNSWLQQNIEANLSEEEEEDYREYDEAWEPFEEDEEDTAF